MNRICTLRCTFIFVPKYIHTAQIDSCIASARISKMHTHKSRSERALRSQVLRIRLFRWIMIQKCPFRERALRSQRVKSGFQIYQERVRIMFQNDFWNVIHSFVNRPINYSDAVHLDTGSCSMFLYF